MQRTARWRQDTWQERVVVGRRGTSGLGVVAQVVWERWHKWHKWLGRGGTSGFLAGEVL